MNNKKYNQIVRTREDVDQRFQMSAYIERRMVAQGLLDHRGSAITIISQLPASDHVPNDAYINLCLQSTAVDKWCQAMVDIVTNVSIREQPLVMKQLVEQLVSIDLLDHFASLRSWPLVTTIDNIINPICDIASKKPLVINRLLFVTSKQCQDFIDDVAGDEFHLGAHRLKGLLNCICKLTMAVDKFNKNTQSLKC